VCNPATGLCDYPFIEACNPCDFDAEPPTLVCPAPVTDAECGVDAVLGEPSARDSCSAVTITSDAPAAFPVGLTEVTFTARDEAQLSSTCTTFITVTDTQAPVVTCPEKTTVVGDPTRCGADVELAVSATDACAGDVDIEGEARGFYGPGSHVVTFTATDPAGLETTCESVIEVTGLDAFTLTCPETLRIEAPADACGLDTPITANVSDPCFGESVLESDLDSFPVGTTTVDFSATRDLTNQTATCSTRLTVVDVTPPTIDCELPAAALDLPATLAPAASDACGVTVEITTVSCVRVSGDNREVVSERCDVSTDGASVSVDDAPSGDNVLISYTVTATDPSGLTVSAVCEIPVDPASLDHDGDGVIDRNDNCPATANTPQLDFDADGIGDACDTADSDDIVAFGGTGCSSGPLDVTLLGLVLIGLGLRRRVS
jgi:hypothetical protein